MSIETIERDFHKKVSAKVRLAAESMERYRVFTPVLFEDGDHLGIVLKKEASRWVLSDEAHTYMHLTYDIDEKDLQRGTRQKIISNALSTFPIEDRGGHPRGFKKAWQELDYATIITVARKIPENVLQEDTKLLMWFDLALTRTGDES
ncbi:MAG: DUF1828 domain-containing protein [Acidobacteria bacterium]|nr:DUF1828 domain-containing protein [Acidobacteriota bacterium]MBI3654824.1 DUF1828 domain-containing protein [Acidobacteriota bacterium]